jgi:hypothetical protein
MFRNKLTLWSRALLERLPVVRPLDSFPVFYGTRRFITELTRALHQFPILSQTNPVHITASHFSKIHPYIIHPPLCLPSDLFSSGFPTSNLYAFLFSTIRPTCPAHLILLHLIILIILGEEYNSTKLLVMQFLHSPVTSSLFGPNIKQFTLNNNNKQNKLHGLSPRANYTD